MLWCMLLRAGRYAARGELDQERKRVIGNLYNGNLPMLKTTTTMDRTTYSDLKKEFAKFREKGRKNDAREIAESDRVSDSDHSII